MSRRVPSIVLASPASRWPAAATAARSAARVRPRRRPSPRSSPGSRRPRARSSCGARRRRLARPLRAVGHVHRALRAVRAGGSEPATSGRRPRSPPAWTRTPTPTRERRRPSPSSRPRRTPGRHRPRPRTALDRRRLRRLPLRDPSHAEALSDLRARTLEREMDDLTLGEAARALDVSVDTLRRWDRDGKLRTVRDARNRRACPGVRGRPAARIACARGARRRLLRAQPLPGRGPLGRGRRRDGARRDRGRPAPRDRGGHARRRRGSRARPRRRRHRGGQGHVGHGRANPIPESTST